MDKAFRQALLMPECSWCVVPFLHSQRALNLNHPAVGRMPQSIEVAATLAVVVEDVLRRSPGCMRST